MFGISGEHLLILGIVLLIFGPRRLPELGNTLGRAIRNFKDAISGVEEANFRKLDGNEAKLQANQHQPIVQQVPDSQDQASKATQAVQAAQAVQATQAVPQVPQA